MKKYETKIIREIDENIDAKAEEMGVQGWMIVEVVTHRFGATIIFKRELKD